MTLPPQVLQGAIFIGLPLLGLVAERSVRVHLRKRLAPDPVLSGASHLAIYATLWAVVLLQAQYLPEPHWFATLASLSGLRCRLPGRRSRGKVGQPE